MADLTATEKFCVDRLKNKLGAVRHHLQDARTVAIAMPPRMHEECGFHAQLAIVEQQFKELHAIVHGLDPRKPDNG